MTQSAGTNRLSFRRAMRSLPLIPLLLGWQAASCQAPAPAADPVRHTLQALYEQQSHVRSIYAVSLSPDGHRLAWSAEETGGGPRRIYLAALPGAATPLRLTHTAGSSACHEDAPQFSPNGRRIAFLSDCQTPGQSQLFVADVSAPDPGPAKQCTHFTGYVSRPQWSPDGASLTVLYVEQASRVPSPMAAESRAVGVIDDFENKEVQRLAVVDPASGSMRIVTPAGLYIFEYAWSPDAQFVAYTAAPPPGDDNWYIARLYTQPIARPEPKLLYAPHFQIALPRWSPDGRSIAFIQGLMSDQGATGGEIYLLPANGGEPRNLTPARPSSPSWFSWLSTDHMLFTEFAGGATAINTLNLHTGATSRLWQAGETIDATMEAASLAVASSATSPGTIPATALVRMSWSSLPELWAGSVGLWQQVTRLNTALHLPLPRAESLDWLSTSPDAVIRTQLRVQGWLLFPTNYDPTKKYPLLVAVHGGPAWIAEPTWRAADFDTTLFTNLGYFVLFPNDRGSYGQGEAFTQANRRDWGHGDLDDMLAGVDTVVKRFPVDRDRVGILGWSYGGSTAMVAVSRSNRFRAAVAGAGASNMQSYYGQNSIDKWMLPYFGASVYDDPAAYLHVSAINYIKGAKTPTLVVVGERDGEAPPAQSFEFWHALKELGVPTQLVIYADEGHSFSKEEDRIDVIYRTYSWFEHYMSPR